MNPTCEVCGPLHDAKTTDPQDPDPQDPAAPAGHSVTIRVSPLELKSAAHTCLFCKFIWDSILEAQGGEEPFNGYRLIQIRREDISDKTSPLVVRVPGSQGPDSDKEFQFYPPGW